MRRRNLLLTTFLCVAAAWPAFAGDRLGVAVPSKEEERVQELIETLTAAITNEDFATYKSCFTKPAKAKYCKDAVIAFVTYDLELEIGKWFVTTSTDSKTVFTIRYVLSRDGRETEFVSEVECVSENDRLLIRRETPRSVKALTASDPWAEYSATCLGGQCQANGRNGGRKRGVGLPGQPDNGGAAEMTLEDLDIFQGFPPDISPCRRRKMMGLPCVK